MATRVKPIFCLPSFLYNDCLTPTEYCNSLTFLPPDTPLSLDALKHWRGTPWVHTRVPVRPAVARALHYGSTPDFDINFTNTNGPRQIKTKCGVIGSGRPKPEDFTSTDITSIKLANAELTKPKVSKFAKFFSSSKPHGDASTIVLVDEFSRTVTSTLDPTLTLSGRDIIRSRRHKIEPHGDMSNLRPDDRGMDAVTCFILYGIHITPEDQSSLISTDSEASDVTTSEKVTFNLAARLTTLLIAEQRAKHTARARETVNEEAAATKHTLRLNMRAPQETDEKILNLSSWFTSTYPSNGDSSITEQIATAEEEEQRGRRLTRSESSRIRAGGIID